MTPDQIQNLLGSGGPLVVFALVIGALIRALKSDKFNILLAALGRKPIPPHVLPWIALGLGVVSTVLDARLKGGLGWQEAVIAGINGLLAGGFAVAGHETVAKTAKAMFAKKTPPPATPPKVDNAA